MIISRHVLFGESSFPLTLQPLVDKPQPSVPARDPGESALDLIPIRVYVEGSNPPRDPTLDRVSRLSLAHDSSGRATRGSLRSTTPVSNQESRETPSPTIRGTNSTPPACHPTVPLALLRVPRAHHQPCHYLIRLPSQIALHLPLLLHANSNIQFRHLRNTCTLVPKALSLFLRNTLVFRQQSLFLPFPQTTASPSKIPIGLMLCERNIMH
jgi:hypothetical protein